MKTINLYFAAFFFGGINRNDFLSAAEIRQFRLADGLRPSMMRSETARLTVIADGAVRDRRLTKLIRIE